MKICCMGCRILCKLLFLKAIGEKPFHAFAILYTAFFVKDKCHKMMTAMLIRSNLSSDYTAEITQFLFLRFIFILCVLTTKLRTLTVFHISWLFSTNIDFCLLKTNILAIIFVKIVLDQNG